MTFRKLFTTIMCITLIITPNFMANAAIEGENGNGATTAVLYAACVGACALAGWFSGGGAAPACLAVWAAIGIASGDEGDGGGGEESLLAGVPGE